MIQQPIHTKSAYLIWQSPLNGDGSRSRLPVAIMRSNSDGKVSFEYLKETEDYSSAISEGFSGYTGIPLDREDTSDAIHTLGRRLPNPDRNDYPEFLERYGLSKEHNLSTLSLLAYTGAKLTSDSYSVSDTFEGFNRPFQYIFDVAGRSRFINETPDPKIDEHVIFQLEPDNPIDPNAIKMVNSSGKCFGYLNRNQTEAAHRWIVNGSINARIYRTNGRANYPRLFVFADIIPE